MEHCCTSCVSCCSNDSDEVSCSLWLACTCYIGRAQGSLKNLCKSWVLIAYTSLRCLFLSSPLHYVTSVYSDLHQAFCTTTSIFTHGKKVVIVVGGGCPRALIVIRRQIRKVALGIASSLSGVFVTDKKQKSGEQHVEHILALFFVSFCFNLCGLLQTKRQGSISGWR